MNSTVTGGDSMGSKGENETADWSGRMGKVILVASPFLFLAAFLILEVWIRGRF